MESKTGVGIEGDTDHKLSVKRYKRSEEQDKQLGIMDTSTKVKINVLLGAPSLSLLRENLQITFHQFRL